MHLMHWYTFSKIKKKKKISSVFYFECAVYINYEPYKSTVSLHCQMVYISLVCLFFFLLVSTDLSMTYHQFIDDSRDIKYCTHFVEHKFPWPSIESKICRKNNKEIALKNSVECVNVREINPSFNRVYSKFKNLKRNEIFFFNIRLYN